MELKSEIVCPCVLSGEEGGVGINVTTKVASKQSCLEMRQQAYCGFFVEKRVVDFILFPLLPRGEDFLSGLGL